LLKKGLTQVFFDMARGDFLTRQDIKFKNYLFAENFPDLQKAEPTNKTQKFLA